MAASPYMLELDDATLQSWKQEIIAAAKSELYAMLRFRATMAWPV